MNLKRVGVTALAVVLLGLSAEASACSVHPFRPSKQARLAMIERYNTKLERHEAVFQAAVTSDPVMRYRADGRRVYDYQVVVWKVWKGDPPRVVRITNENEFGIDYAAGCGIRFWPGSTFVFFAKKVDGQYTVSVDTTDGMSQGNDMPRVKLTFTDIFGPVRVIKKT